MKERKKFNDADAKTVYNAIKPFVPAGHTIEVSVSMDREYFRMSVDGVQECWDSACHDGYSIDGAIGWFESFLRELK